MPVDYDLVILGGTAYARTAALQAVQYGARVALVEPPGLFEQRQQQKYLLEGFQQMGETLQRQAVGERFGLTSDGKLDWLRMLEWGAIAAETQQPHLSVESMSASGIDVVLEEPQRLTRQLTVITESRQLRTRSVLAAYGHLPKVLEPLQLAQKLPASVNIVGVSPEAIEWALALNDCGVQINLIAGEILPGEDGSIRRLMRSHLIVSGINLCAETNPQSELTLTVEPAQPVLELPDFVSLKTNNLLQTSHPRIFACGSILGGTTNEALAQHEATVALHNSLFLPKNKIKYNNLPQAHSHFARIGLTESQAERRYGSAVKAFVSNSANATSLSQMSPMPNYCKLVCANNRLVGVHLVGSGAGDLVRLLAPKIGGSIKALDILANGGLLQLLQASIEQVKQTQWQPNQWQRDWAENWFNWCRSR